MTMDKSASSVTTTTAAARDALVREFADWNETADAKRKNLIWIKEPSLQTASLDEDDGPVMLSFLLGSNQSEFRLNCPAAYPKYCVGEDNFYVESDSEKLQLWCNALNEFLIDATGRLDLASVLSKATSLFASDAADGAKVAAVGRAGGGEAVNKIGPIESDKESSSEEDSEAMDEDEEDEDIMDEDGDADEDESDQDDQDDDEDDDDIDDDDQLDDILDTDLAWELEMARRKKFWRLKEEELRSKKQASWVEVMAASDGADDTPAANDEAGASSTSSGKSKSPVPGESQATGNKRRQPKQIFTSAAASGILTNDLVSIMVSNREGSSSGIEADTVEDNMFHWNVKLRNFPKGCQLDKDLEEISRQYGYDFIELQLEFSMDLYPFYPPLVKVIRPRLQGSFMLRVTTMEILRLSHWNPARNMESVLADIKDFIQTWARLDVASERNDTSRFPFGAYIDIEHHLLRLALVSEIAPRANKKYVVAAQKVALPASAMEAVSSTNKDEKPKKSGGFVSGLIDYVTGANNMAKGTGYSSHSASGWDVKAFMAAQKERDRQIELMLAKVHFELAKLPKSYKLPVNSSIHSGPSDVPTDSSDGESPSGRSSGRTLRKRRHSPDEEVKEIKDTKEKWILEDEILLQDSTTDASSLDPISDLFAVLEGSALIPFLEAQLQSNSFLEMCSHTGVYKWVVAILWELVSRPYLVALLGPLPHQPASLHLLLGLLEKQARVMVNMVDKVAASGASAKEGNMNMDQMPDDKLARDFLNLSEEVTRALEKISYELPTEAVSSQKAGKANGSKGGKGSASGSSDTADDSLSQDDSAAKLYKQHMKPLQFDTSEISLSGGRAHTFAKEHKADGTSAANRQMVFRVAQELSSLCAGLPLDFGSAIFVRADDDKASLLRAVITGPEDTPYSGGCYAFDVYFPSNYPKVPPKVSFKTTGGGSYRFNPNLYACGKVCLSLLGTWSGAKGEEWNEASTVLQVLISIQSLILCSEPYFNEPGYQSSYGTPKGDTASHKYNEDVFRHNLRLAVLGQLRSPPEGFEEVVRAHFYLRREALCKEYEKLLEKYKGAEARKLVEEVKKELGKLQPPTGIK